MKRMMALALCFGVVMPLMGQQKEQERLQDAANVLKEILATPDKGIPTSLLNKADCIVIFPSVKKAAFVVGGSYGRGVLTCRSGSDYNGAWSSPSMVALEGASFGFQIGGQATDFVLLIMNDQGAKSILSSKVKLGADASAAAGPVGRDTSAETDVAMKAEILSYSRARGVFGGVSLEGSTMRADDGANKSLYGQELSAHDIVFGGKVQSPSAAQQLLDILQQASPRHASS